MRFNNTSIQFDNNSSSEQFIEFTKKIYIIVITFIVSIGLIGHLLTICVYSKKEFRENSNSIYLLILSINDAIFLIIHYFEATFRIIGEVYSIELKNSKLFEIINFIDRYEVACYLLSYFRNVIRFNSAYLILALTLNRFILIFKPFSNELKSKKSAWLTSVVICLVGLVSNIWTFFFFHLEENNSKNCDIIEEFRFEYSIVNYIYICLVLAIPIFLIAICNCLVILKTRADDIKRKTMQNQTDDHSNKKSVLISTESNCYSKKITKTLVTISFAYVILNLPYVVSWFFIYSHKSESETLNDHNLVIFQLAEIFHVLNYAISFFAYCLSGTKFRQQLRSVII